jgi:cysteine desulfurase/selenocysteine lyase
VDYATERLLSIDGVRIIGTAAKKVCVISFVIEGIHPHDVGTIVDREGVAIRTGHHCTQPVMQHFGIPATSRASFGIYNTRDDVDALVAALGSVKDVFK